MFSYAVLTVATAASLASVAAWGPKGHATVGYVAMEFLTPATREYVQASLGKEFNFSLGVAATWADDVRTQPEWAWSKSLHFVDVEDDPVRGECSVDEIRDCGGGNCILAAIANYTNQLADASLVSESRQVALKFLTHFFGDLAHPLHVEGFALGGNAIPVTCSGKATNLHKVWDFDMIQINLDTSHAGSLQRYTDFLVTRIATDDFDVPVDQWLTCSSPREVVADGPVVQWSALGTISPDTRSTNIHLGTSCPLAWARESNQLDCSIVFTYENGTDICTTGTYVAHAIPVIARAGLRLASWLNALIEPLQNIPPLQGDTGARQIAVMGAK